MPIASHDKRLVPLSAEALVVFWSATPAPVPEADGTAPAFGSTGVVGESLAAAGTLSETRTPVMPLPAPPSRVCVAAVKPDLLAPMVIVPGEMGLSAAGRTLKAPLPSAFTANS